MGLTGRPLDTERPSGPRGRPYGDAGTPATPPRPPKPRQVPLIGGRGLGAPAVRPARRAETAPPSWLCRSASDSAKGDADPLET
jgi:hypothetical protein